MSRIIAIITGIICILFIASSVALFTMFNNEKIEKDILQEELAQVMKERKKLSLEVEELKLIKNDLEIKASGLEAKAKMLTENYEEEKSKSEIIKSQFAEQEEELKDAKFQLRSIGDGKKELQEMLDEEKKKYSQLRSRIDKLIEVKEILEEKVREIINKQGIELERIVVKAEGELEGKVVVVNREYNFIVVDLGYKDDIELGDILAVFRGGKYIGEAQVEKIYDSMSAATIVKESKPGSIMIDDNVVVQGG
jgi:hypothetical protein